MDIVPSICLSSLAGALFFFTGGRLSSRLPRAGDGRALEAERAARALAEGEAANLRGEREEAARSALEARRALDEERAARAQEAQRAVAEIARREEESTRARAQEAQRAATEIARLQNEGARMSAHAAALGQQVAELQARLAAGADDAGRAKANSGAVETRAIAAEARAATAEKRAQALAADLEKARAELGRSIEGQSRRGAELAEAETRGRREAEAAAKGREAHLRKQLEQVMGERAAMQAQLDAARASVSAAEARAAAADRLRAENAELLAAKAALERDRAAAPDLAEMQRRTVELAMRARVLDQRAEEMDRAQTENADLRARIEAFGAISREAEELRRRVSELEAQGFARRLEEPPPPSRPPAEGAGLATVLERELGRLVDREEGCRMAVLADPRGLLIASSRGAEYPHEVAAASSLTTTASDRLRELMPLGAPASLELYDENGLCVRTRWFRFGEECFLVSTVGVVDPNDAEGAHLRARLGELIGGS